MKSISVLYKLNMSLSPKVLLSSVSRQKCIANLIELPTIFLTKKVAKKHAAVLVPLCEENGEVCLLYTLRSSNLSSHSGQVSFPGGKMDKDETEIDTALRETEEEIGVPSEDIEIWSKMCQVDGRSSKIIITPVVGLIRDFDMNKLEPSEDEVAEIFTVPMKVFCNKNNHGCYMYNNFIIPVYTGGKHTIWGITGIITHLFLQSFLPEDVYKPNFTRQEYKLSELMPAKL
ncbi:unnamed protein product [Chrysodeixis includens]|uniref:Nudix hydrolase domain-containing protein n=1 Tax=Chrysodeixis includens TaxID=689277 RepID=A0A9N8Q149_CHRIL|nr:unnamed protein product [Chrysodeixis includens]